MRGQINQVFLFLVAIIVIIATLYIGFRLFTGFSGAACDAVQSDFESRIDEVIQENIVRGSRNIVRVKPPCAAQELCFVHRDSIGRESFSSNHGIIVSSVNLGVESNVFLVSDEGVIPITYDSRIMTEDADTDTCLAISSGGFEFRTEGGGDEIRIYR